MKTFLVLLLATFGMTAARAEPIKPLTEHKLFSPDAQLLGIYGYCAAVSGNLMVIGALNEAGAAPESGVAYVYQRVDDQWVVQAKLIAPDGQSNDLFSASATIDGDTIAIGAPAVVTPDGTQAGAVYVFRLVAGQWILEAKLFASDPTERGNFGFDQGVSLSGDTLVVGAAGPETGDEDFTTGDAAYVFTRHGSTWTQTARLVNPDGASPFGFGGSVSISGKTIVVGASASPATADGREGAAYVFELRHDGWVAKARLTAADPSPHAHFGFSTAIEHDTIAIGAASGLNDAGLATGSAYVFERRGPGWTQTARLVPPHGKARDDFGHRLALGLGILAVGSFHETNPAGITVGAVHLYKKTQHAWTQQVEAFPSDGTKRGLFTCSLAIDGHTLVVGNGFQRGEQGLTFAGEAYTYELHD